MIGYFSRGIEQLPILEVILQQPCRKQSLLSRSPDAVAGWGLKPSSVQSSRYALQKNIPLIFLEDGFLRSVDRTNLPISLVVDYSSIYYDASRKSDLETYISVPLSESKWARSKKLQLLWKALRLSKYNSFIDYVGDICTPYVLVVDQTLGDMSITHGMANADSFKKMLEAALIENPKHQIILKTHPDTATIDKKTNFDLHELSSNKRIKIIREPIHPVRLIEHADAVYTVTSQIGFEALIWGKRVRCFGMPFYAGWGLTEDELPAPKRRCNATLEQLVHAALVDYPKYVDPVTDELCEVERAMEFVGLQRKLRLELPDNMHAVGFSRWKKPFIKDLLQGSGLRFSKKLRHQVLHSNDPLVLWGAKCAEEVRDRRNIYRIEDGFLRSSGLGADLVRPLSMVIDNVGIYFDSTRPSRLENFLNQHSFNDYEVGRASLLGEKIVSLALTKYNVDKGAWNRPAVGNKVLLVVGQVESDASIEFGSPVIKSNFALLNQVRLDNPDAYIVYKPHPDVLAKLRKAGAKEDNIESLCDEVIGNVDVTSLLSQIDELHTMTSLMGFEALLRGVKVVCHGLPFYAGWGLTQDKLSCERRTRELTIEQLIYGALIEYPRYLHPDKAIFIEPETAVELLANMKQSGVQTRSIYRKVIRVFAQSWARLRKEDRP